MFIERYVSLAQALAAVVMAEAEHKLILHKLKAGEEVGAHKHPKHQEFIIFLTGESEVTIEGKKVKVVPEKFSIHPTRDVPVLRVWVNKKHSLKALTDSTYLVIRYRAQFIPEFRSKKERELCLDKWVVMYGLSNSKVILDTKGRPLAHKDPKKILDKAKELGYKEPAIVFSTNKKFV